MDREHGPGARQAGVTLCRDPYAGMRWLVTEHAGAGGQVRARRGGTVLGTPAVQCIGSMDSGPAWPPEDLIEAISGELELGPLLERLVVTACETLRAEHGAIGLFDEEAGC